MTRVLLTARTIITWHILPSCISSGVHTLLKISSKPTLAELDEFKVQSITDKWEQVLFHLGVESFVINTLKGNNPGQSQEASRRVLSSWPNDKPGTDVAERTWRSVLEDLETSGHIQLADKLKREQFVKSSERLISEPTSLPGVCTTALYGGCN